MMSWTGKTGRPVLRWAAPMFPWRSLLPPAIWGKAPRMRKISSRAGLSTGGLLALWFMLETGGQVSRSIAEERDVASGVRLGGLLLAWALILGRAITGNWHSGAARSMILCATAGRRGCFASSRCRLNCCCGRVGNVRFPHGRFAGSFRPSVIWQRPSSGCGISAAGRACRNDDCGFSMNRPRPPNARGCSDLRAETPLAPATSPACGARPCWRAASGMCRWAMSRRSRRFRWS